MLTIADVAECVNCLDSLSGEDESWPNANVTAMTTIQQLATRIEDRVRSELRRAGCDLMERSLLCEVFNVEEESSGTTLSISVIGAPEFFCRTTGFQVAPFDSPQPKTEALICKWFRAFTPPSQWARALSVRRECQLASHS